ncbi:MAG: threonine--tRNA ligase, partial [Candidatus Hydrogenedentota bacterium]
MEESNHSDDKIKDLDTMRHTASHIMAQAVLRLFKGTKLGFGPTIEDGFYYDFDSEKVFTEEDFKEIEKEMKKIIDEDLQIIRKEISKQDALELFKDNRYKIELINEITDVTVSVYSQSEFTDLCRGPHLSSTGKVKAFKLLKVAGAYWRGKIENPQLQRIYATAFFNKKQLDSYLHKLEEAKKRDHRKIGKELDLFSFHEEGPGFVFWHHKGYLLFKMIEELIRTECKKRGYIEVKTPVILNDALWRRSGHFDNFKDNMYFTTIENKSYAIKPMNCPGSLLIYKSRLHSYRELPLRFAEMGEVHRHELSGVLHGLFRVRSFTIDDAHIYCTTKQIENEILDMVDFTIEVYRRFGFEEYDIYIATRPEKYIGSLEDWELATDSLMKALELKKIAYRLKPGEGAFYGPKIEFNIKDCLKRNWQCGTIQVDFSMPKRFEVEYIAEDGKPHTPVMIHRAIIGSVERFIGVLIEHYKGAFPFWLAPLQVKILTVTDRAKDRAIELEKILVDEKIRAETDLRNEKISLKIREAQLLKVPYMIILGDREIKEGNISIRTRKGEQLNNISKE